VNWFVAPYILLLCARHFAFLGVPKNHLLKREQKGVAGRSKRVWERERVPFLAGVRLMHFLCLFRVANGNYLLYTAFWPLSPLSRCSSCLPLPLLWVWKINKIPLCVRTYVRLCVCSSRLPLFHSLALFLP